MTINDKWQDALRELKASGVTVKTKDGFKYLLCKGNISYTVHTPHKSRSLGKDLVANLNRLINA